MKLLENKIEFSYFLTFFVERFFAKKMVRKKIMASCGFIVAASRVFNTKSQRIFVRNLNDEELKHD